MHATRATPNAPRSQQQKKKAKQPADEQSLRQQFFDESNEGKFKLPELQADGSVQAELVEDVGSDDDDVDDAGADDDDDAGKAKKISARKARKLQKQAEAEAKKQEKKDEEEKKNAVLKVRV